MTDQPKTGLGIADLLLDKREEILRLAQEHRAHNVRVFGSVARGEATETSDIDLLVDFEDGYSLWDQIGLMQDLEELLGRKVDVVRDGDLRERIRPYVMPDIVPL
jgi:hypothetical protein